MTAAAKTAAVFAAAMLAATCMCKGEEAMACMEMSNRDFFLKRAGEFYDKLAEEMESVGGRPFVSEFDGRTQYDTRYGHKWARGGTLRVEFGLVVGLPENGGAE